MIFIRNVPVQNTRKFLALNEHRELFYEYKFISCSFYMLLLCNVMKIDTYIFITGYKQCLFAKVV